MARTVIGYQGVGRARRAIYRDEGPARARGDQSGGLERYTSSSIAALADPDRERAQVVAARHEVWGKTGGHADDNAIGIAEARARIATRGASEAVITRDHEEAVTAASFAPVDEIAHASIEEEPAVMDTAVAAPELAGPTPDRLLRIDPPCVRCVHAPVCWIRRDLETFPVEIRIPILQDGLSIGDWLSLAEVTCGFFSPEVVLARVDDDSLPARMRAAGVDRIIDEAFGPGTRETEIAGEEIEEPAAADVPHGPSPDAGEGEAASTPAKPPLSEFPTAWGQVRNGGRTPRQERTLEAIRDHRGDVKSAARELQVPPSSVRESLKALRRRGEMPPDVESLLSRDEVTA